MSEISRKVSDDKGHQVSKVPKETILISSSKMIGSRAVSTISKPISMTQRGISKSVSSIKHNIPSNTLIKGPTTLVGNVLKDTIPSVSRRPTEEEDDDIAKSKYMMRSIAGLLGTASVYAGMESAQVINDLTQQVSNELSFKNSEPTSPLSSQPLKPPVERKPTLFEISVEPNERSDTTSKSILSKEDSDQASRHKALEEKILKEESSKYSIFKTLRTKFKLKDEDIMIYDSTAWLLKDVLIQGYSFITLHHFLFFAYLPKPTGQVQMTGNINLKSTLRGVTRYWCVLKDNLLSLYSSVSEVYFPLVTIDMKDVSKIELKKSDSDPKTFSNTFKVTTKEKTYVFIADSPQSAKSWYNTIKRQQFAVHNSGKNHISLKIPLGNILELDDEEIINQSVTLVVKALEGRFSYAVDDYIFMFLDSSGSIVKQKLQEQLNKLSESGVAIAYHTKATDLKNYTSIDTQLTDDNNTDNADGKPDNVYSSSHTEDSPSTETDLSSPIDFPNSELKTSLLQKPISKINRIRSKSGDWIHNTRPVSFLLNRNRENTKVEENVVIESISDMPTTESSNDPKLIRAVTNEDIKQISHSKRDHLQDWTTKPLKNLTDMWKAKPQHYENSCYAFKEQDRKNANFIEGKDAAEANKRFVNHFKLAKERDLLSTYYGYLNKNVPTYGKLYLADNVLCFRSLLPGSHTTMILPISKIDTCYTEKSFRFSYFALVLVIRGHEELFIEFYTEASRDDMESILLDRIATLNSQSGSDGGNFQNDALVSTDAFIENNPSSAKLKFFEDKISSNGFNVPLLIDQNPNVKVSIKTKRKYHIGLLTIGSRGDVQPYIALGKGLLKEGHIVTIITHGEFREFVEKHGINFKSIAGDPAELMSLMVEHESMNIGMLREATKKFGGWIKDLLETSWTACKDEKFDILIESPSCISGIHIAEALRIAYFRAFTMPWTRTRAYPHAFVVPDKKRGGNYNYLSYVLFENIYWRGTSGAINKWRTEKLGLGKTSLEQLQQNKVPFLYNVSPTIFPPSVDFNEWVKVTGYWFLDEQSNYTPPKELIDFIQKARKLNKKLVYIGFGSIVVSNASEMTKALVEAVINADVYCILNKGWSERLNDKSAKIVEIELPDCVFNAGTVPHDWLFPQLDAAVHHGGSGTTGATLRAGLPTIIKPFFGDQFFYANRVEEIGVGVALRHFNSKAMAEALIEITTKTKYKEKAMLIRNRILKEDGVSTAINCIYGELEYARSLIYAKNPPRSDTDEIASHALMPIDTDTKSNTNHNISTNSMIESNEDKDSWVML
ncbi:similar to Saccharomyces cerevisiae YLR189C ATG26 UDP-glucose:sterol glucosyltransferase, conserved enzyme involved in synthesis of sterol glucoside membrane lipids [Maudiozyma saulgeensis]|uniref:Sterol 3-beta-glucosyltransferase n=1 Tax=Maudiozyma saulgeensis TaxID=1789683 RepID=A0A1X7R3V2_9SACH|nr:similar to Saccharomyces cerevisiae YLR189C ATG26 UDP-glucose:sterol glucosyltransferase, conserved enzyme involved in synthesis of sterol glucoside membrane lipids [Kazachstania saulgeensis]